MSRISMRDEIEVTIGLYRDPRAPNVQALILETEEDGDGGLRLTPLKATGQWDWVRDFTCTVRLSELVKAAKARKLRLEGGK